MANQVKLPSRIDVPDASPQLKLAIRDIYNKLNSLIVPAPATAAAPGSSTTNTTVNTTLVSISGASGTASNPQYAFVPALTTVPSNNPSTGAPYAQDGLLIGFTPATGDPVIVFRYDGTTFAWTYVTGTLFRLQSELSGLAGSLGPVHAGMIVVVTDYNHVLEWTGSAWKRGPGDLDHSDTFAYFGAAPADVGWHACDGTANVTYLKYDGTTGTRTLPNTAGSAAYAQAGPSYSPTITAYTLPLLTMHSYTPAGSIVSVFVGNVITFATSLFVATAGAVAALVSPTLITPTGAVGSAFTGTPATLTGTIALPGDPVANFPVLMYYRR